MVDTADASKVSNTIVLLIFPIMWNYGAAIIKIISSIAVMYYATPKCNKVQCKSVTP